MDYKGYPILLLVRESPEGGWNFSIALLCHEGGEILVKKWSGKGRTKEEAEKRALATV